MFLKNVFLDALIQISSAQLRQNLKDLTMKEPLPCHFPETSECCLHAFDFSILLCNNFYIIISYVIPLT